MNIINSPFILILLGHIMSWKLKDQRLLLLYQLYDLFRKLGVDVTVLFQKSYIRSSMPMLASDSV